MSYALGLRRRRAGLPLSLAPQLQGVWRLQAHLQVLPDASSCIACHAPLGTVQCWTACLHRPSATDLPLPSCCAWAWAWARHLRAPSRLRLCTVLQQRSTELWLLPRGDQQRALHLQGAYRRGPASAGRGSGCVPCLRASICCEAGGWCASSACHVCDSVGCAGIIITCSAAFRARVASKWCQCVFSLPVQSSARARSAEVELGVRQRCAGVEVGSQHLVRVRRAARRVRVPSMFDSNRLATST